MPVSRIKAPAPNPAVITPTVPVDSAGFVPLAALLNAIRFWWFIFVLIVAGGLAGWFLHRAQPPVYEAVIQFSAGIDYISTGPLTQYDEDMAYGTIRDLVASPAVVQKVVAQANAQGIAIQPRDLTKNFSLERKVTVWYVRVRSANPRTAEALANIWAEQGSAALLEGYRHALQADQLNRYLNTLEKCLTETAVSEPSNVLCSRYQFADIQSNLRQAGKAYAQERIASQGLFSGMTIGPTSKAEVSDSPVIFGRNQLVLSGGIIGLVIGLILVQLGVPARWLKKN